jgi:hypothetical protein
MFNSAGKLLLLINTVMFSRFLLLHDAQDRTSCFCCVFSMLTSCPRVEGRKRDTQNVCCAGAFLASAVFEIPNCL